MRQSLKLLSLLILLLPPALLLWGCSGAVEAPGGTVKLHVTRDFGREEILSAEVEVPPDTSVLELLQEKLEVETRYGGGFITSIGGISMRSGETYHQDWFFYANGITAHVGAGDYYPRQGDYIWFDYHSWGDGLITPSVTGAYPQPFLNGYRGANPGTVILTTEQFRGLAEELAEQLREEGVKQVKIRDYKEADLQDPPGITLVLALWEELEDEGYWKGLQENRERAGWFARLCSNQGFTALDCQGREIETYSQGAGAILSTGSGLGDPRPIWLVTALEEEVLHETVRLLLESPESLRGSFGIILSGDGVLTLPR